MLKFIYTNFRAIYDTGDVHKFVRALERRITHYDKNILKVCTYHYQGFLDSVKQLINLTDKCSEIKVNNFFIFYLYSKCQMFYSKCQRTQMNIFKTIVKN